MKAMVAAHFCVLSSESEMPAYAAMIKGLMPCLKTTMSSDLLREQFRTQMRVHEAAEKGAGD